MKYTNVSDALPGLAAYVLGGDDIGSRAGRVYERRHVSFELTKPWQREVLTIGRGANLAAQIAETVWVLSGRNDIEWLSHYLPRAKDFSDDGKTWRAGYGPRLRAWHGHDQVNSVFKELRDHPLSRRAVISLWDPAQDGSVDSKDIPCNNWIQFMNRNGALEMHVVARSNDLWWGWSGINQFEWSVLQEVLAAELNLAIGSAFYTVGSLHLYDRHWQKARSLLPYSSAFDGLRESPRYQRNNLPLDELLARWMDIEHYIRAGDTRADNMIEVFPEPMLASWLRIIKWYWSGEGERLQPLAGTRLSQAAVFTPQTVLPINRRLKDLEKTEKVGHMPTTFIDWACNLHQGKDEAYGNSWIKRGEMLGAMANIDRKVDRLGVDGGGDTALDTAVDLMLYLAKYAVWLRDGLSTGPEHRGKVRDMLILIERELGKTKPPAALQRHIQQDIPVLERLVLDRADSKEKLSVINIVLAESMQLAKLLKWKQDNEKRFWNPEKS